MSRGHQDCSGRGCTRNSTRAGSPLPAPQDDSSGVSRVAPCQIPSPLQDSCGKRAPWSARPGRPRRGQVHSPRGAQTLRGGLASVSLAPLVPWGLHEAGGRGPRRTWGSGSSRSPKPWVWLSKPLLGCDDGPHDRAPKARDGRGLCPQGLPTFLPHLPCLSPTHRQRFGNSFARTVSSTKSSDQAFSLFGNLAVLV